MKQLLNNWLKNNQLFNFERFKHKILKQNCLLCAANIGVNDAINSSNNMRAKNNPLQTSIHAVCKECLDDLPWHPITSCPQCGLASSGAGLNQTVCGNCISSPPDFDATTSVFLYDFPINAMMQRYKYGNMLNLGDTFGDFLSEKVTLESVDLIIPMPMHPARIKERGFNQALEIAKVLARCCKEKLDFKSVERIKLTPPQASLPLKQRVKNIKDAFKVNDDKLDKIQGKRIAIVDDVMTSGASLSELTKTLKKAGAVYVECWVIARTLPHK